MSLPSDQEREIAFDPTQHSTPNLHENGQDPASQESFLESNTQWKVKVTQKLKHIHSRTPILKRLPFRAVAIITLLTLLQPTTWAITALVLRTHPQLIGTAAIAWVLGLRHALDADHISCIDLMTRRLVAVGQKPVTVGTWFSLGHSTIVVVTSIAVAATSSAASKHFDSFSRVGGIIGSFVSAAFLVLLGVMNIFILVKLLQQLRALIRTRPGQEPEFKLLEGGGCLFHLIKRLFKLIDRSWKMYPVGVMFGLGFDTSSEVALLGISALQASKGTSLWFILTFPLLFTAGMCLVDTIDGALMMSLYTSAAAARDPFTVTYYSVVLTGITVVVALFIGVVQALELADAVIENPTGSFWDGVERLGNSYDIIGAAICASFVFFGILSVICYKPWRRWIERKRTRMLLESEMSGDDDADDTAEGLEITRGISSNDLEIAPSNVESIHIQGKDSISK